MPSRNFDTIELDKKTNVHIIMLDSLTHSAFTREFMGIENPAADYLETLDDTIYAGSSGFSERIPTMNAWGTVFNLGTRHHDRGFFSGRTPSRLTALLRQNGYNISTGYSGDFFGWFRGEYVDNYYRGEVQTLKSALFCTNKKGKFWFCSKLSNHIFVKYFSKKPGNEHDGEKSGKAWPEMVIELVDRAERGAKGPLFSAFHIYLPGHTPKYYRSNDPEMFAEYKRDFVDGVQRARKVIENINLLRRRYPRSIFIVSGDHGPFLSRTAPEEDRRFRVLDKHGVALALLNASNLCAWSQDWLARQPYLTPSRMLAASLACNGESRRLAENFTDNEEFLRFSDSLATAGREHR